MFPGSLFRRHIQDFFDNDPFFSNDGPFDIFANDPFFNRAFGGGFGGHGRHQPHPRHRSTLRIEELGQDHPHAQQQQQHQTSSQPIVEEPDDDDDANNTRQTRSSSDRSGEGRSRRVQIPITSSEPDPDPLDAFMQSISGSNNNNHVYSSSSSTFYSYSSSSGRPGDPVYYSTTSTIRRGPGGVMETRHTVQDSRTGREKVVIKRALVDKEQILEKTRDVRTGQEESKKILNNIREDEEEQFDREWRSAAQTDLSSFRRSITAGGGSNSRRDSEHHHHHHTTTSTRLAIQDRPADSSTRVPVNVRNSSSSSSSSSSSRDRSGYHHRY